MTSRGVLLGSDLGQILSAKGPDGVRGGVETEKIRTESGLRTAKLNDLSFYMFTGFKL